MGHPGSCPLMKFHALPGPAMGCPYDAVGMQRALDSAIGLPSSSTSASWMLWFLIPADVRSKRMLPSPTAESNTAVRSRNVVPGGSPGLGDPPGTTPKFRDMGYSILIFRNRQVLSRIAIAQTTAAPISALCTLNALSMPRPKSGRPLGPSESSVEV